MGNLHKRQRKEFELFVERKVPKFLVNSVEIHILTGQELLDWGWTKDPNDDSKPIIVDRKYIYRQPVQTEVNHARRIHKAFDERGPEGINDYLFSLAKKLREAAAEKKEEKPVPAAVVEPVKEEVTHVHGTEEKEHDNFIVKTWFGKLLALFRKS